MTGRRAPSPPRRHSTRAPNPGDGTINLTAQFETRMSGGQRKMFNGVIRGEMLFDGVIEAFRHRQDAVHQTVKGLFKENPELIEASPQQVCIEVALQLVGAREMANIAGTTVARLRAMFTRLIQFMPVNQVTLAMSRMKLHDRDLEADPHTRIPIRKWRDENKQGGDPNRRRQTLVRTKWRNLAGAALDDVERANQLRRDHLGDLRRAPVLSLCTEEDGEHRTVNRAEVDNTFPDVA